MDVLTNVGVNYDSTSASRGLPEADLDLTGVTQILYRIRVNKIGTGDQSWQLWNETDATEIAVFVDAGAVGDKSFSMVVPIALLGIKTLRVRAKSTVGSDDPVLYSARAVPITP